MKANFRSSLIASAALLAMSGLTSVAHAAPASTPAGQTVSNTASLDYKVGGTDQPQLKSCTTACTDTTGTPTTFTVDLKVNVTVTTSDTTYVSALPVAATGQSTAAKFTVTNTGNGTQDFALSTKVDYTGTVNSVWGTTNVVDNLDPTTCTTYVDTNNNGVYDAGTDLAATYIDELAAGASKAVFVACTFPTSSLFDQQSVIALKATAEVGGTANAEGTALTNGGTLTNYMGVTGKTVNVVFADAAGTNDTAADAAASALDAFHIDTSRLQITKAAAVLCDPVNGTTNPKNIPGALVRYTITIKNETTGVTDITRVKAAVLTNVGDLLDVNLDFDSGFLGGIAGTGITAGTCAGVTTTTAGTKTGAAGLTTTARTPAVSTAIDVSVTAADPDNLTIPLTTVLTAGSGHALGELQAGETATVVFNAAIK